MLFLYLIFTALAALIYYIYQFGTKNENIFVEKGLAFRKPTFIFGNSIKLWMRQISAFDFVKDISKGYQNEKLMGYFDFRDPVVLIFDPDILKRLAVKEFESFPDHRVFFSEDFDPLFGNSIFSLTGQKWKDMRATLSPAFTGSKMRLMCDLIVEICEQMVDFLKTEVDEKGLQIYETKELFSRLATDIIGTCAFGIKVDSLKDKDNNFYVTAKRIFTFTNIRVIITFMLYRICPWLMELLNIPLFHAESRNFMKNLVVNTMKTREEQNIVRPDMIHLLMEARKGNLTHTVTEKDSAGFATVEESEIGLKASRRTWTEDEIVAQCFGFFLAGFDTVSTVTGFIIYEIMVNQDVQDKLFEEISEMHSKIGGESIKYESLQHLKYLDMVISETLRKWPAAPVVDRICTRDFTLKYDNDKEFTFHKGDVFWVLIAHFHRSAKYFPNPDKFDPERFSDENKASINPAAYLPFGVGPRNCIGSRFALMELKSIIYYLILNFHIETTEKTQIPVKLANQFFGVQTEKGIHVQFRPRN
ncbi:probable cytochrome P450 9f2 [Phlebotomus argentipes]|uniref:probable cytochrome P450 9f2 n=1 Tax=Phlebotomus argentipes TaxID=94469 RepID=UPI002892DA25|nr:probable cytochrome P450 9f2 [Phlebotomus argentipes]